MVIGLLGALSMALRNNHAITQWPRTGRALLWWTLGTYSGWSTIAVWINLTTAMAGSGAPLTGIWGVSAQVALAHEALLRRCRLPLSQRFSRCSFRGCG